MSEMSLPARIFTVPSGRKATRIPGFRIGCDSCRLRVPNWDMTLYVEKRPDGVALVLSGDGVEMTVSFPGLPNVPLRDVAVALEGDDASDPFVSLEKLAPVATKASWRKTRPTTELIARPGAPIPSFEAFAPGVQAIEVDIPWRDGPAPTVSVKPSADGRDGILMLDGRAAAILSGAPFATSKDIRIRMQTQCDA